MENLLWMLLEFCPATIKNIYAKSLYLNHVPCFFELPTKMMQNHYGICRNIGSRPKHYNKYNLFQFGPFRTCPRRQNPVWMGHSLLFGFKSVLKPERNKSKKVPIWSCPRRQFLTERGNLSVFSPGIRPFLFCYYPVIQ